MNKTLTFSKKIFLVLCLVVSIFFVNAFALLTTLTAGAVSSYYGTNTIEVKNGDFNDYTSNSSGLPYDIDTGWKGIEELSSTSVTAGIIDVGENFYNKTNNKFGLQENPGTDSDIVNADNNILMIKAKSEETRYGYVSNEMTLSAGKFYLIKVHCKTGLKLEDESVVNNATASIYTSLSKKSNENFINIDTNGNWKTYNIFVATDSFNASNFTMELRLGNQTANSNGVVFFDKVQVLEVANIDYFTTVADSQNIVINLDNDYTPANNFQNANFEGNENLWTANENNDGTKSNTGIYSVDTINQFIKNNFDANEAEDYASTFVADNNKQLFISNHEATNSSISSSEGNNLTINQFGFYHLSMLVKTGNLSGDGLNVTLSEIVEDGETAITVSQTVVSSTDGAAQYNNFKKVDFYIRGNAWKNKNVSVKFSLGTEDKKVTGWAIVDEIKLQQINQSEFNKKSSSNELDLSKNIKNTETLLNGSFDFNTNTTSEIVYPAAPLNWTYSEKENNQSGIVRVRTEYFNADASKYGLAPSQNPGPNTSYEGLGNVLITADTTYENVLMIRNTTTNNVSYSSDSFSLTSNTSATTEHTFTKIQVAVKTLNDSKAFIQVVTKDTNLLIATIENISAADWTTYTLFIKNGITAQDVKVVLGTEGNGNNNYSFFDFAKYSTKTGLAIADVLATENSTFVDLSEDSFYSHTQEAVRENIYKSSNYSIYAYEESKSSAVYNGITDTALNNNLKTRNDANDTNILVVTNNVASYQHLISNYTYNLMKGSYYEISVWVKTDFTNCVHDDDFGAYIELVTLDEENEVVTNEKNKIKFTNFSTSTEDNNGWVKYTMYVLAEEEDQKAKVLFGLGNQENLTKGTVYFDDLKVIDIKESEYSNKKANKTTLISKVIPVVKEDTDKDKDTNTESTSPSDLNIWALSSSIILVVALALAIAGYLIRRIPKKKIVAKIEKSSYNKAPNSVDENEVKRQLKANREQKLEELNKKLEELKAEKDSLQKDYEEKINKEENPGEKEKLYVVHTKKINKLNKEIDYLSSAVKFASDETNIKISEIREIKKRKKEVEQEFLKMKSQEISNEETNEETSKDASSKKKK